MLQTESWATKSPGLNYFWSTPHPVTVESLYEFPTRNVKNIHPPPVENEGL